MPCPCRGDLCSALLGALLCIGAFASFHHCQGSGLPLDDTSTKFILDIDTEVGSKLHEATKAEEGRLRVLKDARGRTFNCYLPVPDEKALSDGKEKAEEEQTAAQLLAPLKTTCLFRQEDWWTYEICPGQHVRQFHQHNQELQSQYDLGKFDSNATDLDRIWEGDSGPVEASYVEEVFDNGEACDLTQAPRSARVRYSCSPSREGIQAILEPATCKYLFLVATPRLCEHPALRNRQAAISRMACHATHLGEGNAPGFGGPPLKLRPLPQPMEAQETEGISTHSHPLSWLTNGFGNVKVRAERGDLRNHFDVKVQGDDDLGHDDGHVGHDSEDDDSRGQRQRGDRRADQQQRPVLHAEL
ncbi:hypothetical protein WJX73_009024 [Symbiochloris irregularis]|uniref:MRH domain-containing protein n=1 Tax=Symbiochloris irregularis TaxID=706552 RepID=A0AAW1NRC5_9CHLO